MYICVETHIDKYAHLSVYNKNFFANAVFDVLLNRTYFFPPCPIVIFAC